ncbi:MAG: hypothetical protein ACI8RO_001511, partial [Flavobacteriales bacterium]
GPINANLINHWSILNSDLTFAGISALYLFKSLV